MMAMALFSFSISLLGFMPAPILFGYVIDGTCKIWKSTCGNRGACQLYDLPSLRYWLKGLECGFRIVGLLFYIIAYIVARYVQSKDDSVELKIKTYKKTEDEIKEEDIFTISRL
ncbi:solute carrier organic anion transporter family member 74D-like isoform X2 [Gigantopelta aegis]|uniref:solute carrier organic anion transporter family member 74D-like isoform X2 n=1 Tax=Gigantopelta aegis TaxID=1735272 RepID=UPI001B88857E|nr:solute carrier organic anion transporter family member 74D-like isoform X2 [Gigantopelta aegis]